MLNSICSFFYFTHGVRRREYIIFLISAVSSQREVKRERESLSLPSSSARTKREREREREIAQWKRLWMQRKVEQELDLQKNSYLGKILAVEGSRDVAVGQPIAVTAQKGQLEVALEVSKKDDHWIADKKSYLAKILALEGSKDVPVDQPIAVTVDGVTVGSSIIKISRAAKLLIREHGLDASSLRASGAHGTLLKGDVLAAIKSGIGSSKGPLKEALARKDLKKDDHWVADEKRLDCWTAPLDGIMKINIDSLWRKLDTKCVLVVLVRNSYGVIQACLSRTTFCATPLDGEASAALLAVEVGDFY